MEPGEMGEGDVPQIFSFRASIEEIDNNPTMYRFVGNVFVCKVHPVMFLWVQFLCSCV
jgi:hypothetical protein